MATLCLTFSAAQAESLAPGYRPLSYSAPVPGSYSLPILGAATDGQVLDSDGRGLSLHSLYGDKIVVLGFIYATCDDVNGCPLSTSVFHKLQTLVTKSPGLQHEVRLITLSFNPEHDTPEAMRRYGEGMHADGFDWRFLTTGSEAEIRPILRDYGQSVEKEVDAQGRHTGKFSHILRVFLIDRNRRIRNTYTVSVLHPELVLADLKTLLMESDRPNETAGAQPADIEHTRAGDDKRGYELGAYRTDTQALPQRLGKPMDLLQHAHTPALGLPELPEPKDNPLTAEKITLGRKLFFDRRLSLNNTFSCAMCHIPEQGYTSQEQATALGIEGRTVRRNAPTLYNVAYLETLFHDGRESTLENQVWGPLLAANEMGNPSVGFVIDKVKSLPDYGLLFKRAFGREPSMETVGQALASYERTLLAADSAFDRWRYGGDAKALSAAAQTGYALFTGKAGCVTCHSISERHALFTDHAFHNTGVGYRESMHKKTARQRIQIAPGLTVAMDATTIAAVAEPKPGDLGRYEITLNPADRWKYRTPSLRNVALTAPYMHNGAFADLRGVLRFYNQGGEPNENLDPRIRPLGLNEAEIDALTAFLESLTSEGIDALIADAWAAPVGDAR